MPAPSIDSCNATLQKGASVPSYSVPRASLQSKAVEIKAIDSIKPCSFPAFIGSVVLGDGTDPAYLFVLRDSLCDASFGM